MESERIFMMVLDAGAFLGQLGAKGVAEPVGVDRLGGLFVQRNRPPAHHDAVRRARTSLDRHATYTAATYVAGAAR